MKKWIVNSYKTDFDWIYNYTSDFIVYDKTGQLPETDKVIHQSNVGYNIYDYCYFIINNYENLPDICVFIKANVFKHCKEETFKKLIANDYFTPLEDYSDSPITAAHIKDKDGGYMEINNSWYIYSHMQTFGAETNRYFRSYNQFLETMFENPKYPTFIRFAPGANYIVPKKNILFYSLDFWKKLMGCVDYHQIPTEAHIIERALYYIFTNTFDERKIL